MEQLYDMMEIENVLGRKLQLSVELPQASKYAWVATGKKAGV